MNEKLTIQTYTKSRGGTALTVPLSTIHLYTLSLYSWSYCAETRFILICASLYKIVQIVSFIYFASLINFSPSMHQIDSVLLVESFLLLHP